MLQARISIEKMAKTPEKLTSDVTVSVILPTLLAVPYVAS